jgi:hypothetical protein
VSEKAFTDLAGSARSNSSVIAGRKEQQASSVGASNGSRGRFEFLRATRAISPMVAVRAIYLAGSHTWTNGMEDRGTTNPPLPFDYNGYMSFMKAHNFNWMRLWTTEMAQVSTSDDPCENIIAPPFKWIRTGPEKADDGAPKDNFTQPDPKYFDRMRSRIIQAGQNGIYVSVMLFNGYMWQFDEMPADGNPFESGNNVNSLVCSGVCPSNNSEIRAAAWSYEQAYLQKVVDTVND